MGTVLKHKIEFTLKFAEVEIRRFKLGLINPMPKATERVGLKQK